MSAYTPQQAWSVAYSDIIVKKCGLDSAFAKLGGEIKERSKILDKSLRVKITAWLAKLSEETHNEAWKKNRNAYAKLLLEQLKCGRFEEPFNANPPAAPLPTLSKTLLYPYTKPKTSTGNTTTTTTTNSIFRPNKMRTTPSQQLDSYLSYQGGDATPSASRAALPSPLPFTSYNTPTSRLPHLNSHIEYINTAASHAHQQQQHTVAADPSPWDGSEAGDSLREDADVDVDVALRLAHAEERLQQHSTLLSLLLDASSADHQLQQMDLREEEEERNEVEERQLQRYQQRSVAEVLERAERGNTKGVMSPSKSQALHADAIGRVKNGTRALLLPSPEANGISEESLLERLAHFNEKTARLKSEMSNKGLYTNSSLYFSSGGHHTTGINNNDNTSRLDVPGKGTMPAPITSCTSPGKKSNSVSFIPARHTLKSTAAAVAIRKSLETSDGSDTENSLIDDTSRGGGGGGNENRGDTSRNLRKAAALLKPRPGSTTALISEVAALRKRVANSLACIEESHWDGALNIGMGTGLDIYNPN